MLEENWITENKPELYWNMLQTAEQVSKRYSISRRIKTDTEFRVRIEQQLQEKMGNLMMRLSPFQLIWL